MAPNRKWGGTFIFLPCDHITGNTADLQFPRMFWALRLSADSFLNNLSPPLPDFILWHCTNSSQTPLRPYLPHLHVVNGISDMRRGPVMEPIFSGTCMISFSWIIVFSAQLLFCLQTQHSAASSSLFCLFLPVSPLNSLTWVIRFLWTKSIKLSCSHIILFFYDQYSPKHICKYFLLAYLCLLTVYGFFFYHKNFKYWSGQICLLFFEGFYVLF